MGSFLDPDPTRIIAKRILLTGHPFRVHKKTATIRYMFFSSGSSIACMSFRYTTDLNLDGLLR
jgi:hypothetical protein